MGDRIGSLKQVVELKDKIEAQEIELARMCAVMKDKDKTIAEMKSVINRMASIVESRCRGLFSRGDTRCGAGEEELLRELEQAREEEREAICNMAELHLSERQRGAIRARKP